MQVVQATREAEQLRSQLLGLVRAALLPLLRDRVYQGNPNPDTADHFALFCARNQASTQRGPAGANAHFAAFSQVVGMRWCWCHCRTGEWLGTSVPALVGGQWARFPQRLAPAQPLPPVHRPVAACLPVLLAQAMVLVQTRDTLDNYGVGQAGGVCACLVDLLPVFLLRLPTCDGLHTPAPAPPGRPSPPASSLCTRPAGLGISEQQVL